MSSASDFSNNVQETSLIDAVRQFRKTSGVALNAIEADTEERACWPSVGHDVEATLEDLIAQQGHYRWRMLMGRYVIYPTDSVWDGRIAGIAITGRPRLDAATQYVKAVRGQVPALRDLLEPPIKGDPRSPVYTEPVSLRSEAPILIHLMELLGWNKALAFTIQWTQSGRRILHYQEVTPFELNNNGD